MTTSLESINEALQQGSVSTTRRKDEKNDGIAKRRQSGRLKIRPGELHGDCSSKEELKYPLCNDKLSDDINGSNDDLISCCSCGRGYHVECSGIKKG